MDAELFRRLVKLSSQILTVEEHVLMGGFGSAVMEFYESEGLLRQADIKRLGIPDRFYEQAAVSRLYEMAGINLNSIIASGRKHAKAFEQIDEQNKENVRQVSASA